MLAPGEYLINPAPKPPDTAATTTTTTIPIAGRDTEVIPVVPPAPRAEGRPPFLLILLRALGAVHT